MTHDEKVFLKQAIKNGAVLTNLNHLLGPIGTTSVKQVSETVPYGKPHKCKPSIWVSLLNWIPFVNTLIYGRKWKYCPESKKD